MLGERIARLATFETRSKAWQDLAVWQGLRGRVGVSTLWMFVSGASKRCARARTPIASKVTWLTGETRRGGDGRGQQAGDGAAFG